MELMLPPVMPQDPLANIAEQIRDQFDGLLEDGQLRNATVVWPKLTRSTLFSNEIPYRTKMPIL